MRGKWLLLVMVVVGLSGAPPLAQAQERQAGAVASFLEALKPVLEAHHVFALDAESFSEVLAERLGWTVSTEEVEASLGPGVRFGRLFRFLACEAYVDCIVAGDGAHLALAYAQVGDSSEEVELYLTLHTTENDALTRHRESLALRRAEGVWRVVVG